MDNNQQLKGQIFPFVVNGESVPHVATTIFQLLDQNTAAKSREVSKVWKDFVDNRTKLWGKVSAEQYIQVVKEGRQDICRLILQHAENKNPAEEMGGWTPLHEAAMGGHQEVCRLIIQSLDPKNFADGHGQGRYGLVHGNFHFPVEVLNLESDLPIQREGENEEMWRILYRRTGLATISFNVILFAIC